MANVVWCDIGSDKLYHQSGEFSSTVKDSQGSLGDAIGPGSVSFDGTNTPWGGVSNEKLYLQSGLLTGTIKTSLTIGGIVGGGQQGDGISWDGTNTPWGSQRVGIPGGAAYAGKMTLQSGQFSSTIKTSLTLHPNFDVFISGISFDGTNTPWISASSGDKKLFLQSGQFVSTLKTSQAVGSIDGNPLGTGFNGTDTLWCGTVADKLYLQSGQFTSTVKTSLATGTPGPSGVETDDVSARLGTPPSSIPVFHNSYARRRMV